MRRGGSSSTWIALVVGAALWTAPGLVWGKSLSDAEIDAIEKRLAPVVPYAAKLSVPEGGTVLVEREERVPRNRIRQRASAYEAIVTGIVAPSGMAIHSRMDSFELVPEGDQIRIVFRYVVHADPGVTSGGNARLTLSLVERTGLANVVHRVKLKHWFDVERVAPSPEDLAADFWGYRRFNRRMRSGLGALKRAGLRSLSPQDDARLPALDRVSAKVAARAVRMVQERTRMWSAHRHLLTASRSPDPRIARPAQAYLGNLGRRERSFQGVPNVAIIAAPEPPPAEVEVLEPSASVPAEPRAGSRAAGGDTLEPVATYEVGSDAGPDRTRSASPGATAPPPGPTRPVTPAADDRELPREDPTLALPQDDGTVLVQSDDLVEGRSLRRVTFIPTYYRALTLDDPNIGFGASLRLAWANVELRESAIAAAFTFFGQVAITRDLGLELTVPTEYVNVDVDRARAVFAMGNPLVALKWRTHLPKVEDRRPVLTLRGRWGIPLSALNTVPPTTLVAEDYSREAHVVDPYAFFLEKTALGLGASLAWQWQIFYFGLQIHTDYFIPLEGAQDQSSFATLGYGTSFGALPFGDLVGFFLETRAVSLLLGSQRTEFFTYLGARGRPLPWIEPALWVGYPLGSVRDVSGLQVGLEVRFPYDLDAIFEANQRARRDDTLLE